MCFSITQGKLYLKAFMCNTRDLLWCLDFGFLNDNNLFI